MFRKEYAEVFEGTPEWKAINVAGSDTYDWQDDSTYIRLSPFFDEMLAEPAPLKDIHGARILAMLGIPSRRTISLRRGASKPIARQAVICKAGVSNAAILTPTVRAAVTMKS
jgi:aconitate hydratase